VEDKSEERDVFNRQRARSAAKLFLEQKQMEEYQAYGCQLAEEKCPGWLVYQVLVMAKQGQHDILVLFTNSKKVCIQENTNNDGWTFVLQLQDLCQPKIQYKNKIQN
jgi:hypothetical protein